MEFTQKELYDLLNRAGPLWLVGADLSDANLMYVNLQGAILVMANLNGANLERADLRNARLEGVSLRDAMLRRANLENAFVQADLLGAWLGGANFKGAVIHPKSFTHVKNMTGAIMPNGMRYDGRFNLEGDIKGAQSDGVDIDDPHALAQFYGVPVEDYLSGQEWAKDNL